MRAAPPRPGPRLLDREATAAIVFGAHDWTEAGLGRAPSFLRSAKGVLGYLIDSAGLGLDPTLVIDLFDDTGSANDQLARIRDSLDVLLRDRREEGRPVADLLVYYVGHGHTDEQNHLALLVRRSRRGMEAETGIKAPDLARVLRVAAPQQRRLVVLDCCFSEAAARDFMGQSGGLDQAVAATAAKDLGEEEPRRGSLLLCSSPVGEVSIGPPRATRTLFSGAVLDVLRLGAEGHPPVLSFAALRDAAYQRMLEGFGANAPRPVLHQVNATQGDLTRLPAFPNRAPRRSGAAAPPAQVPVPGRLAAALHIPDELFALAWKRTAAGDDRDAAQLYRLAADQGLAAAQVNLGVFYEAGRGGLSKDDRQAAELYRLAAEQGFAAAQANLGLFYETGRGGLPKDDRRAAELYELAADQGNAHAQVSLGVFHETGRGGLPKDDQRAAELYRLAADQGFAVAQFNLGFFYETGRGGLSRDDRRAVELYKLAADQGFAAAQVSLGIFYEAGRGDLQNDEKKAVHLYKLAVEQGNAHGRANLGRAYNNGLGGLPKDTLQAAQLIKTAASHGDALGQFYLGFFYEQGHGNLPKDDRRAVQLYQSAARGGNDDARNRLRQLGKDW
ncbi:SEL1-like repeat protein [Roseicella sp. DB1501]|uniref:SEL1-like repeat protein n=1 Tax=Roseicella sp. DB1501 TaxID=2730925 RepID=UPI001491BE14|nr:SEL1-like repeat protein [Roseicella sp. DB1501]NOG71990.1 SEL1-like repeat protein [Roseicella sp. DB1501]